MPPNVLYEYGASFDLFFTEGTSERHSSQMMDFKQTQNWIVNMLSSYRLTTTNWFYASISIRSRWKQSLLILSARLKSDAMPYCGFRKSQYSGTVMSKYKCKLLTATKQRCCLLAVTILSWLQVMHDSCKLFRLIWR